MPPNRSCRTKIAASEHVGRKAGPDGSLAGVPLGNFPRREVQVRGLSAPLAIRVIDSAAVLARYEPSHLSGDTERAGDPAGRAAPAYDHSA